MICPNCGSFQSNNISACVVCGYEFESSKKTLSLSNKKNRLNSWEIILICILLFMILSDFFGIRIISIFSLPIRILGQLFGIYIYGIFYLIIVVLLALILIYGIYKRERWSYFSIFALCILSLVLMFTFGLFKRVGFQEISAMLLILIPIFFINLKVYKMNQGGQNG